jgi:hypothetical protein
VKLGIGLGIPSCGRLPFSPLELDPAAWFRRGDWTVTGSGISQWNDSSGNGRHLLQGTDAARPTGQSDGSALFNGTSHFLKCSAFTLNQPTWVVMAVKQVSWTASDTFFDGNADATGRLYQIASSPRILADAGTAGITSTPNLAVDVTGVVSIILNGASSSLRVNNTAATTGNAGAGNMGGFTLGTRGSTADRFANIQVYEVAIFPIAPSAAQQDQMVRYMGGIVGLSL